MIEVIVRGLRGAGKTHLMKLFVQVLRENNYNARIVYSYDPIVEISANNSMFVHMIEEEGEPYNLIRRKDGTRRFWPWMTEDKEISMLKDQRDSWSKQDKD